MFSEPFGACFCIFRGFSVFGFRPVFAFSGGCLRGAEVRLYGPKGGKKPFETVAEQHSNGTRTALKQHPNSTKTAHKRHQSSRA